MKCVNCNFENNEGAIFCNNCGNPLIESNNLGNQTNQETVLNDNITNIETNNNNNLSQPNQINSPINNVNDINNNQQNISNDMNGNQVSDSNNIKKVKRKKKHRFLKFLLFVVLIILLIKGIKYCINKFNDYRITKSLKENYLVQENEYESYSVDELKKKLEELNLLNVDSNNDGLTNAEKLKLGLSLIDEDSDNDGLTDFEEINKYKSDPTKYSTSGDVFGDGYKVYKNLDINKYYQDNYEFNLDRNSDITLTATKAEDLEAYYKEFNGTIPSEYILGYKPFRIYSYSGNVKLKINNPKYFNVISYDTLEKKSKSINSKVTDNGLEFKIEDDNPIIVAYKPSEYKKLNNANNGSMSVDIIENPSSDKSTEYIVIASPLGMYFKDIPIYILEINDSLSNIENKALVQRITSKENIEYKIESYYISRAKSKLIDSVLSIFKAKFESFDQSDDKKLTNYLLIYDHLYSYSELEESLFGESETKTENKQIDTGIVKEDSTQNNEENNNIIDLRRKKSEVVIADSGFDLNKNAFRFKNLQTKFSSDGVCSGFSMITSSIYNNVPIPSIGKDYNLSNPFYNSIWNKELYNYEPQSKELSSYTNDEYGIIRNFDSNLLEEPDKSVVKALEYYQEKANNDMLGDRILYSLSKKSNKIDSSKKRTLIYKQTFDQMVSLINDGNILFTGVITENGGHAINVYKITQDANDEDIYYLKVYDSNFPLNSDIGKNGEIYIGEMEMMLKKHYVTTFNMGDIEYYTFSYNINKNWTFASNFFKNDDYLLIYYPVMKSNNLSLKKISTSLINY